MRSYAMTRPGLIEGFTGINDPFQAPGSADLAVDTAEIVEVVSVGNGEQVLCGAASISSPTPLKLRLLSPAIARTRNRGVSQSATSVQEGHRHLPRRGSGRPRACVSYLDTLG